MWEDDKFPRYARLPFGKNGGGIWVIECSGDFDPAMAGAIQIGYWEKSKSIQFGTIWPDDPFRFLVTQKSKRKAL